MTRKEALKIIKGENECNWPKHCEAYDMAIKALEQETCKPCIYYCEDGYCRHSVNPEQEQRKGHWIETKEISTNRRGQIVHEVICSECSGIAYFRSMGNKYIGANLCPNCGAKMGVEE